MSSPEEEASTSGNGQDFTLTGKGVANTGFFSLPGLGRFDIDETDKYFPFRNHNEDTRDPRQVSKPVLFGENRFLKDDT